MTPISVKPRTRDLSIAAFAAFHGGDAIACHQQVPFIVDCLDGVQFPTQYRYIFPPIKAAAAVGLSLGRWFPALGRLTSAMLMLYYTLAVASHVRVKDYGQNIVAAGFFAIVAAVFRSVVYGKHQSPAKNS